MKTKLDLTGVSAKTRRLLVLGISGGDESADPTPDLETLLARVEGIADLLDDDLVQLDADLAERLSSTDDLDEASQIAEAMRNVRGTYLTRLQEAADHDAALAAIRDELLGGPEDEPEGETPDAEPDPEAEPATPDPATEVAVETPEPETTPEPALVASAPRPATTRARRPQATRPRAASPERRFSLRASANVPGTEMGADLADPVAFADALGSVIEATEGYRGPRVFHKIATIGAFRPEEVYGAERTLNRDAQENERKIRAVTGDPGDPTVLRASGGICAPPQVDYSLPTLGTDVRPFRDTALARFGADRGGIRSFPMTKLSEVTGAVSAWTEANDRSPNSPTTKPCLTMTCPDEDQTLVDAIVRCLKIGNFRARFFPEQIAEWQTKIAQYHARFAETRMITQIGAGSTQVTVATVLGTTRDVLSAYDRAAAAIRSRHRLPADFPLRGALPDWVLDNMRVDLSRELPGSTDERLAMSEAQLNAFFSARNLNMTWFLDGESGQIFGDQGDGALIGWPSHVIGYLYPEGSWLALDGGSLDLGLVRDSTLNSTNDFQLFAESFENTHFHGLESYRMDIDICPNGATAAATTITPCTSGS